MISLLFWNLMGNQTETWAARAVNLRRSIVRMADAFDVDLFLFVESGFAASSLLRLLNRSRAGLYTQPITLNNRIQVLTKLPASSVVRQFDSVDERLTIRRVMASTTDFLLAVLHFQSQLNWTRTDQALQATVLHNDILQTEGIVRHQRTVLVGDLNMNPYDEGVVGAQALNAVMTRDLAADEERTVSRRQYRLFYNPMWGFFGDRTPGPPGSYFYSISAPVNPYWNIFDQVLLRPDLINALDELRILDTDGQESLVTARGRPRSGETTDHLPIFFRLNL